MEEFIRKLFRGLQCVPQSEVLVFDSGSRDSTVAILELLSRHYPLGILTAGDVGISPAVKAGCISKEVNGCCYADLRKLQGKDLFRAASFLARLN
ncbi:MAG: hypothetical protein BWY80_01390 [Firmicutes bacterium ADurb.Bin456]|nr:MAG: hypothetical protein BWY80_01390 [Firmicutes bacterium ADurb.Bin456]